MFCMLFFLQTFNLGHGGNEQVVDDIAGEEEGVDEAAVLVTERLGRHRRLNRNVNLADFYGKHI
mgnify:CR=1 FL=1